MCFNRRPGYQMLSNNLEILEAIVSGKSPWDLLAALLNRSVAELQAHHNLRESDMAKQTYITKEGLEKLKAELNQLMTVERPKISKQIAEARDKGDLSENAEYDAAKDAQGMLELKISQMQEIISNSRIIDESKLDNSKARILSTVTIENKKTKQKMTYTLVPDQEADLKAGKLSVNSPIAQALLGKKVGDSADVKVPAGVISIKLLEIK